MSMPTGDPELDEFRRLQEEEYGEWVAVGPIYVGNALAYPEGGAVPKSNVERHAYDKMGLVEKRSDYLARQQKADPEPDLIAGSAAASAQAAQVSDAGQDDGGDAVDAKPARKTRAKSTSDGE